MNWQQLSVITSEHSAAGVSEMFDSLGAVSVTYMDAADQPVYEPLPGETKIWTKTKVIALFEEDIDTDRVKAFISTQYNDTLLEHWQLEKLQDQVWERAWMAHYQPMKFGPRLWVCPTGQERSEQGTTCLTLDPGLAFGTGTHPTTALCLEWLSAHDVNDQIVIDYGCGSGILAIAAVLLGAKSAHAVDIDPQALTASRNNAEKNQVSDHIMTYQPENFPQLRADIVLANILAKPLIELAAEICGLLKPGGRLILSGILAEQQQEVAAAYAEFIQLSPATAREDWCRLDGYRR